MAAKILFRRTVALVSVTMATVYMLISRETRLPVRVHSFHLDGERYSRIIDEENANALASSSSSQSIQSASGINVNERLAKINLNRLIGELFPTQFDVPFVEYQLNVSASNAIAVDRPLADFRSEDCRRMATAEAESQLPDASIVIPFHDESWSMLLRTIHGVLDRSPPELVRELILVDDMSTYDYLGQALERYLSALDPRRIRIIRNRKRLGLIRSRLVAAREARGNVLVFLDAHVEVGHGWLQPLLSAVKQNRTTVFVPRVDSINPRSIDYEPWPYRARGGFTWTLNYVWKFLRSEQEAMLTSDVHPYPTATTIGCAMAVDRNFFFHFGAFDEGMSIWGGENIEVSIRAWMCAGGVYIVPCSRVGHVFRHRLPYQFPAEAGGRRVVLRNYQRLVEVWFDDHRKYYYVATGTRRLAEEDDVINLADRRVLRDRLQCRSFTWFMNTVLPDLCVPQPGAVYHGQLKNVHGLMCMRWNVVENGSSAATAADQRKLVLEPCGYHDPSDTFSYFANSSIVHAGSGLCLTASARGLVFLDDCRAAEDGTLGRSSQVWTYNVIYDPSSSSSTSSRRRSTSTSGSGKSEEAVGRNLVLRSPDATDTEKPVGRLSVELSAMSGLDERKRNLCLAQLSWSDGRQVAGTIDCMGTPSHDARANLFTYWVFTYELNWAVIS